MRKETTVITGDLKILFPNFFTPDKYGKYSCTVLIPKSDTTTLNEFKEAKELAIKNANLDPTKIKNDLLKDGDKSEHEGNHGHWILSVTAPGEGGKIDVRVLMDANNNTFRKATQADCGMAFVGRLCVNIYASRKFNALSKQLQAVLITEPGSGYNKVDAADAFVLGEEVKDDGVFADGFASPF